MVIKTENLLNTVIIGRDNACVPPRPKIILPKDKELNHIISYMPKIKKLKTNI